MYSLFALSPLLALGLTVLIALRPDPIVEKEAEQE